MSLFDSINVSIVDRFHRYSYQPFVLYFMLMAGRSQVKRDLFIIYNFMTHFPLTYDSIKNMSLLTYAFYISYLCFILISCVSNDLRIFMPLLWHSVFISCLKRDNKREISTFSKKWLGTGASSHTSPSSTLVPYVAPQGTHDEVSSLFPFYWWMQWCLLMCSC